jgi:hypothetical protein
VLDQIQQVFAQQVKVVDMVEDIITLLDHHLKFQVDQVVQVVEVVDLLLLLLNVHLADQQLNQGNQVYLDHADLETLEQKVIIMVEKWLLVEAVEEHVLLVQYLHLLVLLQYQAQ